MKNFWVKTAVGILALFAIEALNRTVLTSMKPMAYYYTAPGFLVVLGVALAEVAVLWPMITKWSDEAAQILRNKLGK